MGAVSIDASLRRRFGFYEAYIGKKLVMAATGVILFGYILGHLAGNLLIFSPPRPGPDGELVYPINTYAGFLHSNPNALWIARAVLIAAVVLHIWSSFQLWLMKRNARPAGYVKKDDVGVTYASRTMMWTGPIIAAFVVFHILHLTTGTVGLGYEGPSTGTGGHEQLYAFQNLVHGFRMWPVAIAYVVCMVLLSTHLYHGIWSMFQSVGFSHPRYTPKIQLASKVIAVLICIGFISIPIAVLSGAVGSEVR